MITRDNQKEKLCQEALDVMKLSASNRQLIEEYLESAGDEKLIKEVERENFAKLGWDRDAVSKYLTYLKKKKKTEELKRFIRFLAEAGGLSAHNLLFDSFHKDMCDLEGMLAYLEGEHAEEQKVAIRVGVCSQPGVYMSDAGNVRKACMDALLAAGREDADVFLRAMPLCEEDNFYARIFLLALHLHVKKPGEAPKQTQELEALFAKHLLDIFQKGNLKMHEMNALRAYALSPLETPFPENILKIYRRETPGTGLKIFAGCAFLALLHSERFEMVLRLMVSTCYYQHGRNNMALDACLKFTSQEWFDTQMNRIEEMLPIEDKEYILWCLERKLEATLMRMASKSPEGMKEAITELAVKEYPYIMSLIEKGNQELYQELKPSMQDVFWQKIIRELTTRLYPMKEDADKKYLMGEEPFSVLLPFTTEWDDWFYDNARYELIEKLRERKELVLYQRAVVLEGFRTPCFFLANYPIFEAENGETLPKGERYLFDRRQLIELFRLLELEKVPFAACIEVLGNLCETLNDLEEKKKRPALEALCIEFLMQKREEWGSARWDEAMKEALDKSRSVTGCCLCLQVLENYGDTYQDLIFSCAANSKKKIREQAVKACIGHRDWEDKLLELLDSKKLKEREFALFVLEEWGDVSDRERVRAVLEKEKNQKLKERFLEFLEDLEKEGAMSKGLERMAFGMIKGAKKRKVEWVLELSLPEVHDKDGNLLPAEYPLSILALYADMETETLGRSKEANKLVEPLEKEEFFDYIQGLYDGYLKAGAEAKKRWVLYAYAFHGREEAITVLQKQLSIWADNARGAMAAEAVRAIALNGSQKALLMVDQMSRKHKSRQVKNAAAAALSEAAEVLKISKEELEDQIVPDLGFDKNGERIFDYGTRSFRVWIYELELEVYDEHNKPRKNLPAPGKKDEEEKAKAAYEEFKQLKKQLKTVVASQKIRLLQALRTARLWNATQWKNLFVQNPVMHQFAIGLIWGVYESGELKVTFRYMGDGSFNTSKGEEYKLSDAGKIGLVHPLELSKEELEAWKEQLLDHEVGQPIEQLWRSVYQVKAEEKEKLAFDGFYGKTQLVISLSGKLLGAGWHRGEVLDAGFFENYYRRDGEYGAELTFSGCSVGYENPEVTVYSLYFYQLDKVAEGSSSRDTFLKKYRCRLEDVSARYFSEVILELTQVLGESDLD